MKKPKQRKLNLIMLGFSVLGLLVILQFVLLGVLYRGTRQMFMMQTTNENNIAGVAMTGMNTAALSRVAVSPSTNAVYLPELHLKLPMTDLSVQLVYDTRHTVSRGVSKKVTDISTLQDASTNWAIGPEGSCTPLRLAFENTSDAFNTHEKPQPAVKLADGRTMQVYVYDDPMCGTRWHSTKLDPMAIAALFESSQSY